MANNKRIEFSKKLAILNTLIYVLVLLFCLLAWVKRGTYPKEVFTAVTAQYSVVLTVYMSKAGYENGKKYNNESGDI